MPWSSADPQVPSPPEKPPELAPGGPGGPARTHGPLGPSSEPPSQPPATLGDIFTLVLSADNWSSDLTTRRPEWNPGDVLLRTDDSCLPLAVLEVTPPLSWCPVLFPPCLCRPGAGPWPLLSGVHRSWEGRTGSLLGRFPPSQVPGQGSGHSWTSCPGPLCSVWPGLEELPCPWAQ